MILHSRLFHTHLGPRRPKRDADKGTANPRGGHNRNLSEVIDRPITAPGSGARAISEPRLRSATAAFYMIYIYISVNKFTCATQNTTLSHNLQQSCGPFRTLQYRKHNAVCVETVRGGVPPLGTHSCRSTPQHKTQVQRCTVTGPTTCTVVLVSSTPPAHRPTETTLTNNALCLQRLGGGRG